MIRIFTKCSIQSILMNSPDGIVRDYLTTSNPTSRLEDLVALSVLFQKQCPSGHPYIETKIRYGSRDKRIELIFKNNHDLYFCKITNNKKFDKDMLDLDDVITSISDCHLDEYKLMLVFVIKGEFNQESVQSFLDRHVKINAVFYSYRDVIQQGELHGFLD